MSKRFSSALLPSLLGIAIGVLGALTFQTATNRKDMKKTSENDWRKLNIVLREIDRNYVDTVDRTTLTQAAIEAVLSKLDPHSVYLPPQELEDSESSLAGGFDGIGIQFNVPNDTAVVIEVIPGGPSEKIGLKPGDRILKVDDKVIAGVKFPQDSMVRRMKGPAGTKVLITVNRTGEEIPFEITRGKIPTHSIDASFMVDDTTAYLRLSKFSRTTYSESVSALHQLRENGMKSLIIDLRDNSGGYFDQAINLSNLFLPKDSIIVSLKGLHREEQVYRANGRGIYQDIDLKVLINEGSASSSEIFTGAIQDNSRGVVYGRRSFGKGLVQEPLFFSDGSGIRITTARFYSPSGKCIQKPYSDDYLLEVYKRYNDGEMVSADSMKNARGGIYPDVFVPIDTTKITDFHLKANRKATAMRFASSYFDSHAEELSSIGDYAELLRYLDNSGLERRFLEYAERVDGLSPKAGEWEETRPYLMVTVKALVGRYSKLGDKAFYHIYLDIDDTYKAAVNTEI